jgi:hypothetical protein
MALSASGVVPPNIPVLVGAVPLFKVQTYLVTEGYKSVSIPASSFVQMVGMTSKIIAIDALLVGGERALRPALEALALNLPGIAQLTAFLESFIGIPVVSKNFVHLDMQITQLKFTQDNQNRDTLTVHIDLVNVPRPKLAGLHAFAAGFDIGLGVGSAFL